MLTNLFEVIPGADFSIICTKSNNKVVKVHTVILWKYSGFIVTNFHNNDEKMMKIGATVEDVSELMNIIYNADFKKSNKMEYYRYEFDVVPIKLYSLVVRLEIRSLQDPSNYEIEACANVGSWDDVENISTIAEKATDWIVKYSRFCTNADLKSIFLKRMVKILAMYTIVKLGDLVPENSDSFSAKMFVLPVSILKMIAQEHRECILELMRSKNTDLIVWSWWFMFLAYYAYCRDMSKDEMKEILNFSSHCMIKAYANIGCSVSFTDLDAGKKVTLFVADILDKTETHEDAIKHDLENDTLICYVAGSVHFNGDDISIEFPMKDDEEVYAKKTFTCDQNQRKMMDDFVILARNYIFGNE